MNSLNEVKKSLKNLQQNFNPNKATYKIFDELIEKNYSSEQMYKILSKLHGVDKYPESIKKDYNNILDSLKSVIEKEKQIANTNELKGIIDKLEQTIRINNLKLKNSVEEVEVLEEIPDKKIDNNKKQTIDIEKTLETLDDQDEMDEKEKIKLINRYLLVGIVCTFLIAVLLFYLY